MCLGAIVERQLAPPVPEMAIFGRTIALRSLQFTMVSISLAFSAVPVRVIFGAAATDVFKPKFQCPPILTCG
jgi:hypothetical protein